MRFNKSLTIEERQDFFRLLGRVMERVSIIKVVRKCRERKDDKFLELAVNGNADFLITGDEDLLSLEKIHNTRIIKPAAF